MMTSGASETVEVDRMGEEAKRGLPKPRVRLTRGDMALIALPIGAFLFWLRSLQGISLQQMNDLGLVSVFSPFTLLALVAMMIGFCMCLQRPRLQPLILLLHLCLLIFMLYGVTTLIEEAPRFSVLYRHAGYTEYIMRTGTVDPGLDAYFNWTGFFILSAFVTRVMGYPNILSFAVWAPVFFNVIYLAPLHLLFSTFTTSKRLVWLALWFFCLTNWIGQDYYSPQGLDFFLYLVIIATLLRWFKTQGMRETQAGATSPRWDGWLSHLPTFVRRGCYWLASPTPGTGTGTESVSPGLRRALLALLLLIFAFIVASHPLTPFFVLASVTALVFFRRCTPAWLPVVLALMMVAWILLMTRAFLAGHLDWVTGGAGHLTSIFSENVGSRVSGSPQHELIAQLRLLITAVVWGLAFVGCLWRMRRGYRDVNALLLAVAPFPLLIVQPYGGEMLLRIYLFSLPCMAFFGASLLYTEHPKGHAASMRYSKRSIIGALTRARTARAPRLFATPRWKATLTAGLSLLLLAGFLFARYGNERQDYMTSAEVAGVQYLYSMAQPGAVFIAGTDGTPWQSQDFEKYNLLVLTDSLPSAVTQGNTAAIMQFIRDQAPAAAYLILTRSQEATLEATFGAAPGTLDRLETALIASGDYRLIYSNPDARILLFTGSTQKGAA